MDVHSENTVTAGDRMYSDILAGVESGMGTILVLSGVMRRQDLPHHPYQPVSEAEIEP